MRCAGSVSGGCVESDVYENAREVLETGEPKLLLYGIKDEEAWEVGLPCGGEIDVFVELRRVIEQLAGAGAHRRARGALHRRRRAPARAASVLVIEGGEQVGDGVPDEARRAVRRADPRAAATSCSSSATGRRCSPSGTGRRRACSSTARSTPPRRCARRRSCSAGRRSSPTRARSSPPRERIPSADELIVEWPDEALAQVAPDHADRDRRAHPRRQVRRAGAEGARSRRRRSTSARSARAGTRSAAASGCSRPASPRRRSTGSPARAASTSAPTRSPRRRSRSWPRSSPCAPAARAAR